MIVISMLRSQPSFIPAKAIMLKMADSSPSPPPPPLPNLLSQSFPVFFVYVLFSFFVPFLHNKTHFYYLRFFLTELQEVNKQNSKGGQHGQ